MTNATQDFAALHIESVAREATERGLFHAKIRAVASLLGGRVECSDKAAWASIVLGDVSITASRPWNAKGRIAFKGGAAGVLSRHAPSIFSRSIPRAEITVDGKKTAEQIAKDITRRFLPVAEVFAAAARKSYENTLEYNAVVNSAAGELRAVLGDFASPADTTRGNVDLDQKVHLSYSGSSFYGDFNVGRDSVNIDLKWVPHSVAVKVAALLAENRRDAK